MRMESKNRLSCRALFLLDKLLKNMTESTYPLKLSPVLIHLLKGILFRTQHPALWEDLLETQIHAKAYLSVLGLDLEIDENEGYAWLTQQTLDEEGKENNLPRLVTRRPLSYPISLLCVLLRKKVIESDASGEQTRVIVSRQELQNAMLVFMPEKSNEAQINEQINTYINKVIELGFLRKLKTDGEQLEIQRIIVAFVDADWTATLNEKLAIYQDYVNRAV
jgi:Domain of unknown function (DUF4194)